MYRSLPAVGPSWWITGIVSLFWKDLRNTLTALDSPAARQLLLHNLPGGAPHPEFLRLQADLQTLGYPQQCRNVAVVNGNRTDLFPDSQQRTFSGGRLSPGDKIFNENYYYVLANLLIDVYTNKTNQENGKIMALATFGTLSFPSYQESYLRSNFNKDLTPGGFDQSLTDEERRKRGSPNYGFRFSFVPLFSSVDYRGTISTDQDQYIDARPNAGGPQFTPAIVTNNLTPFAQIYGTNVSQKHINIDALTWENVAQYEFNITPRTTTCGPPPVPFFGGSEQLCNLSVEILGQLTPTPVAGFGLNSPGIAGTYSTTWRINPNPTGIPAANANNFSFDTRDMPPGTYTISATRRYLNVSTPTSSASKAFYVLCPGWECLYFEGSFVYRLNDNGQDVFSRFSSPNSIQYATTAAGEFVSRSRLISNGCLVAVANCFAETDPRGPTTPTCSIATNACYTIQVQKTGQRLQAMGNNTVNQQPANNQNNQIWKAEDRGNGWRSFAVQDGTNRAVQAANGANNGETLALTGYNGDGRQNWAMQCNPADNSLWRVVYPNNNYTWDLRDFGNQPVLQIYGNTSEPFYDYRSFRFQPVGCPSTPTGCNFNVSASNSSPNLTCGQSSQLSFNCSGSDCGSASFNWSGNGLNQNTTIGQTVSTGALNSNGSFTYTLTASKAGCANSAAPTSVNVTGCGTAGLALATVSYDCNSGVWTWQYTGGNGGSIETYCPGAFGNRTISANNPQTVTLDVNLRNGTTFYITAIQGGQTYNFQFLSSCTGGGGCFALSPSASNVNPGCNVGVTLNANCGSGDCSGVTYAWSGNGLSGGGSSIAVR